MPAKRAKIKTRLEAVMESILCPAMGGWSVDGYCAEYSCEEGTDCHVLEVWPLGFYDTEGGRDDEDICYQFAELEFGKVIKEVWPRHFRSSKKRSGEYMPVAPFRFGGRTPSHGHSPA